MCKNHYYQWRRRADPSELVTATPPARYQPCSIEECEHLVGKHGAKGMCRTHYARMMRNGEPELAPVPKCSIRGCEREHYGRGWCQMHYDRWRRTDSPLGVSGRAAPRRRASNKRHRPPSDVEQVIALRRNGMAFSAIGKQLGMTKNAAFALWRRNKDK